MTARTPPCPYDARCGGCDLSALVPAARRARLEAGLRHTLSWTGPVDVVSSPRQAGYRARIKLGIAASAVGYRPPRSHEIFAVDRCHVARDEVNEALARLAAWIGTYPSDGLSDVEIRSDGTRAVFAFTSAGSVPRDVRDALPQLGDVALDGRRLAGDPTLELAGPVPLRASPNSFTQVNLEVNAALVDRVRAVVLGADAERVLDLYAGIGNLGLPIAAAGVPVVAVEREGQAVADLRANAERAGLADRVRVIGLPVEKLDPSREAFDVVVLDPPRKGAPGVLTKVVRNRPRRVVYVACNPSALARDLREAAVAGYRLEALTLLEMFPDTHHVEALAVLHR